MRGEVVQGISSQNVANAEFLNSDSIGRVHGAPVTSLLKPPVMQK